MTSFSNFKSRIVKESSAAADPANQVSSGAGTTEYATTLDMPTSGIDVGSMGFVAATNSLYVWTGTSWFNIATTNQAPTAITGGNSSYQLNTDGTPTVVTLVSSDPEGFPLTWSATTSGDTQVGTLTNADNVFTITPSINEADVGTLSVTFSVTDGNNTETAVSVFILSFLSPPWSQTALSIGTSDAIDNSVFVDRSTNAHTVTTTGTPLQTSFHPYLDYYSAYFSEDTVTIPTSPEFNVGNGDFTFETWINTTRNDGTIFDHGGNYLHTYNGMRCGFTAGSGFKYTINRQSNSASGEFNLQATTPINDGKWHHIRACRSGSTFRIFIDGVLDASSAISVTGYQPASVFVVGGALSNNVPTSGLTGNLFNFRLIKGTALNTTDDSFDPPTENLTAVSGTSLLLFNDKRFVDRSSTSHSLTFNGNPAISAFNPFGQGTEYAVGENKGSVSLDGSSDYMSISDTTAFDFSTGYTCVEAWIYPKSIATGGGRNHIFTRGQTVSPYNGVYLRLENGYPDLAGSNNDLQSPTICKVNEWSHIVFQFNPNGEQSIWLNGVRVADRSNGPSTVEVDITNGIGHYDGGGLFDGYISDLKIRNGVSAFYSGSTITVPTVPVGNTNASLYLPMDNAGIFDKTGNNTLTLAGDTSTSTTQTKFADTAIYFDGSGDYITEEANASYGYGTSDFTIEYWMYLIGAGTRTVFSNLSSASGTQPHMYTSGTDLRYYTAGADRLASGSLNTDQWYHVALCRSSSSTRLFIDGTQVGGTLADTYDYGSTAPLGIGTYHNPTPTTVSTMSGYLENIQVLKGVAKYTTNFTPPNRTQGRTYQAES